MRQLLMVLLLGLSSHVLVAQSSTTSLEKKQYITLSSFFHSSFGTESNKLSPVYGLQGSIGYQWKEEFGVGIGSAIHFLNGENIIIPVFVEARGVLSEKKLAPYYAVQAGYGVGNFNSTAPFPDATYLTLKGTYLVHPAIGLRFDTDKKIAYTLDLGVVFQRYNGRYEGGLDGRGAGLEFHPFTAKEVAIRVGVTF